MVPAWLVAGGGSEDGTGCVTQLHHRLSPCCSIPEGLSSGISLEGVQHQPAALQGLGNPREECGASCLPRGKGQQESPYVIAHGCRPVIWQDDAVGKAPVLGSSQHPSHGAARGCCCCFGREGLGKAAGSKKEGWEAGEEGAGSWSSSALGTAARPRHQSDS